MTTVMKSEATPSDREVLTGLVERVTYQNAESGYCVLRIKARGHRELITLVGHAAAISAGEWATATGNWVNDRTHGQQFKARFLKISAPTSAEGIEKYLASGTIRGIGPVYAKKLLRAFGEKVFDIIEAEPDRLREVDGIGPVALAASRLPGRAEGGPRDHGLPAARHGWCASTRPTAAMPCRSCRRIPIAWHATSVASGSRPPMPSR
jgi:ATP-dependent exoDNAse (exonuclease V) alpha subunit